MNKTNIWRILGMAGMVVGFIGTVLQDYAEDKDLDARIDEAVNKKLAEAKSLRGSDASLSFHQDAKKSLCIMEESTN